VLTDNQTAISEHPNAGENGSLSPPYSNFTFCDIENEQENSEKLENFHSKISVCCLENQEFVNKTTSEIVSFPITCNNRACINSTCKEHREYLFKRNHQCQIEYLHEHIRVPKAGVATGWLVPINQLTRSYIQEKFKKLTHLLNQYSRTPFSVHMEIKLYPLRYQSNTCSKCRDYCDTCYTECSKRNMAYLHFHFVSGYINNIRVFRKRWGRVVRTEGAIKEKQLSNYVSKYASKTPFFNSDYNRDLYHLLVYKTQMHRFSVAKKDTTLSLRSSEFYPMDLLDLEIFHTYKRDMEKNNHYHPFIDSFNRRKKPPPVSLDNWGDT
jgi:hypothetical protein